MAAATISTVAVATMVMSSSTTRRPLTFAGAILLPDNHASASTPAPVTTTPAASPSRTPTRSPAAGTTAATPPVTEVRPAAADRTAPNWSATHAASTPGPAAAGTGVLPAPSRTVGRPSTPPATPESASNAIAHALVSALNKARRDAGLPALAWSPRLQRSAAGHNEAMAQAGQLGSRVTGEPALGARQANQGVLGNYAAEVVGSTGTLSSAGAQAVQQAMLAEQAPNDSRRQTLLSGAVDTVGIDVLLDPAHGRLWVTEDFAQLS